MDNNLSPPEGSAALAARSRHCVARERKLGPCAMQVQAHRLGAVAPSSPHVHEAVADAGHDGSHLRKGRAVRLGAA